MTWEVSVIKYWSPFREVRDITGTNNGTYEKGVHCNIVCSPALAVTKELLRLFGSTEPPGWEPEQSPDFLVQLFSVAFPREKAYLSERWLSWAQGSPQQMDLDGFLSTEVRDKTLNLGSDLGCTSESRPCTVCWPRFVMENSLCLLKFSLGKCTGARMQPVPHSYDGCSAWWELGSPRRY